MAEALVDYDYDAEQDDELTLHVGDVIKNVVTADGGWWEGELKGKKGMFPDNFVKLRAKEVTKKEEKREATQRKSVKELANKFKDGVPMPGGQGSVPPKKKDPPKVKKCKVMFDYKPENEDELELAVGQTIDFIREVEEGWWEGGLNGKTGVFPSNFVEMTENGEGEHHGDGGKPPPGSTEGDLQQIRGKKVVGVGLGNIFQGGPIKLRNTTKKAAEPPKPAKVDDKPVQESRDSRHSPANTTDAAKREKQGSVGERAVVRYSYAAEQPDELSLKEGEVIRVLDKHLEDEGWWRGEAHGKVGVFPDNFVDLMPSQEPSKAPKKPPPPAGKNIHPKLPDKTLLSMEEKNASLKKDQGHQKSSLTKRRSVAGGEAAADKPPANAGLKKTAHPPPIGRKPGAGGGGKVIEAASAPKPEAPRPSEPSRAELRVKEPSANHHGPSLSNKTEDGEEGSFDAVEATGHKLVHLTASRAKGPKKRPPSTVNFSTDGERVDEEPAKGHNHVHVQPQPEKPLPPAKEHKHISPAEPERGYLRHPPVPDSHLSNSGRDAHNGRHSHATAPPPRPPEPALNSTAASSPGPDTSALTRLVEDLQREMRELRSYTVSKNDYNDLRSEHLRLKQDFEVFRANHSKKLRDLMTEVDEEKKLRLNTQVEMERIRKLLAETHV